MGGLAILWAHEVCSEKDKTSQAQPRDIAQIKKVKVARKNTNFESQGAEFLVLGNLLINGISAYKTYFNMPAYDLVATNPELNTSAKIQVKSRWTTKATGFLISRFDSDFVVFVRLNLDKIGEKVDYYVFPTLIVEKAHRSGTMPKVVLKDIANFQSYVNNWSLIRDFLDCHG